MDALDRGGAVRCGRCVERIASTAFEVGEGGFLAAVQQSGQGACALCSAGCASDQTRGQRNVIQERLYHQAFAHCLHRCHQIHRAATKAASVGRKRNRCQADLGKHRPRVLAEALWRCNELFARLKIVAGGQVLSYRIGQQLLLFVEFKIHLVCLCCLAYRPSVILAMMLR